MLLLNCFPPHKIDSPSGGLSILKAFLNKHHYLTRIKYWNLIKSHLNSTINEDNHLIILLPYLVALADMYQDKNVLYKLIEILKTINSDYKKYSNQDFFEYFFTMKNEVYEFIDNEIEGKEYNDLLLFGIPYCFEQWIPGMVVIKRLKKFYPHIKTVIGGFKHNDSAVSFLKMFEEIDFAIWGEGEFPLMELCSRILSSETNFESIPRLAYKKNYVINISNVKKGDYLDFNKSLFPDYKDYFQALEKSKLVKIINISLPIEGNRGCFWRKCKFCAQHFGYQYREKSPENIVAELEYLYNKYNISRFAFMDLDIIGSSFERINNMLDSIITSREKNNINYKFVYAEFIPKYINDLLVSKMKKAGFYNLEIGFESTSDNLLSKMNKINSFADNILFIKLAKKNQIKLAGFHFIAGIPEENIDDIIEAQNNLYYLRFFIDKSFQLDIYPYALSKPSPFYMKLNNEEKKEFTHSLFNIASVVPASILNEIDHFNIFRYMKPGLDNMKEWSKVLSKQKSITQFEAKYQIKKSNNILYFKEIQQNEVVNVIEVDKIAFDFFWLINENIQSLQDIYKALSEKYENIKLSKIQKLVKEYQSDYLIYSNKDYSEIISTINIENPD